MARYGAYRRAQMEAAKQEVEEQAAAELVRERIAQIERVHQIGTQLLAMPPGRAGERMAADLIAAERVPPNDAKRYEQFVTIYSAEELRELYDLFERLNFALSFTHFRILLPIKDKVTRDRLLHETVERRLTVRGLQHLVDLQVPTTGGAGGRKSDLLQLAADEIEQALMRRVRAVQRVIEQLLSQRRDLPPSLRAMLQRLQSRMQ